MSGREALLARQPHVIVAKAYNKITLCRGALLLAENPGYEILLNLWIGRGHR